MYIAPSITDAILAGIGPGPRLAIIEYKLYCMWFDTAKATNIIYCWRYDVPFLQFLHSNDPHHNWVGIFKMVAHCANSHRIQLLLPLPSLAISTAPFTTT